MVWRKLDFSHAQTPAVAKNIPANDLSSKKGSLVIFPKANFVYNAMKGKSYAVKAAEVDEFAY